MDNEDFFSDSLHLLGGNKVPDSDVISYGPLRISIAPKVSFTFGHGPYLTNKQEGKVDTFDLGCEINRHVCSRLVLFWRINYFRPRLPLRR